MQPEVYHLHQQLDLSHWWFVGRRRILQSVIREVLPPSREAVIVDVGCATGGNTAFFNERYTCLGVDASEQAIAMAQSRFPQVRFLLGGVPEVLGETAAGADLFLLADVLEHVRDARGFLEQWMAAASPGAYFLVTVPADPSLWSPHDESHGHFRRYDPISLARLWEGLPVSPLLLSYFNSRLYPLIKWARRGAQKFGRAGGGAGTDLRRVPPLANRLLEAVLFGEAKTLLRVLRDPRARGYRRGVSLIALLRKDPARTRRTCPGAP